MRRAEPHRSLAGHPTAEERVSSDARSDDRFVFAPRPEAKPKPQPRAPPPGPARSRRRQAHAGSELHAARPRTPAAQALAIVGDRRQPPSGRRGLRGRALRKRGHSNRCLRTALRVQSRASLRRLRELAAHERPRGGEQSKFRRGFDGSSESGTGLLVAPRRSSRTTFQQSDTDFEGIVRLTRRTKFARFAVVVAQTACSEC